MQRTTGNFPVTTTTVTEVTFGSVSVGANAVRLVSSMPADSKHSDPRKSGPLAHRLREHAAWRCCAQQRDNTARIAAAGYQSRAAASLPPRLWAAWVLSQSLCG